VDDALSDRVNRKLSEVFTGSDLEKAKKFLLEYQSPSQELNERIYLDILRISNGSLDKIHQFVGLARTDYRDLILCAEYDFIDGKPVLKPGLTEQWWKS